jgi:hypothetical protein
MKGFRRTSFVTAGLVVLAACERGKAPPPVDTTTKRPASPIDSAIAATTRNWDASAGPVLLVAGETPAQAYIIAPDRESTAAILAGIPRPATVTLVGKNGTIQTSDLQTVGDGNACEVSSLSVTPPPRPWSIGFVGGVIAPVALDSTASLSPADSASLVVGVTRLASLLPNDTAGRFVGLPFVVRSLWRFRAEGTTVVIATLARQVNQEASPLQEHTLLIAEQPANDTTLSTSYFERSFGDEETVESYDVLAAATIGATQTPAVILTRDYGDATAYGLIERNDNRRWSPRWRSARRRC